MYDEALASATSSGAVSVDILGPVAGVPARRGPRRAKAPSAVALQWTSESSRRWNARTTDGDEFAGTVELTDRYVLLDRGLEWVGGFTSLDEAQKALDAHVRCTAKREQRREHREMLMLTTACGTCMVALGGVIFAILQHL